MKDGWKMKKLGEVCLFENGDRGENYPSKSVQTTSGVPFINAGHLTDFGIDYQTLNFIPRERFDLLGNGKIRKNDILFCLRGSLGKFACVGKLSEGAIASSLVIVRPCKSVLKSYVLAYFQSDLCAEMISKFKNGAAQPNLSAGNLKEFKIPLPALPEQQRIVAILDEAFEGIATAKAKAEKNLKNARQLFESHLNSVFSQRGEGWVEKTIEQICSKITDGEHLRPKMTPNGIPFLSAKDVLDNNLVFTDSLFVSETDAIKFRKRCNPERGDILIVSRGATVGRTCVVNTSKDFCLLGSVILLKVEKNYSSHFIAYALKSSALRNQLMTVSEAAAQPAIYLRDIKTLRIGSPSLIEQEAIVCHLDKFSAETQRLESIYQKKIEALDALKKSILQKAFDGEL